MQRLSQEEIRWIQEHKYLTSHYEIVKRFNDFFRTDKTWKSLEHQWYKNKTVEPKDEKYEYFKSLESATHEQIPITPCTKGSEASIIALFSDLHYGKEVCAEKIENLNHYDSLTAKARAGHFFASLLKLYKIVRRDIVVKNIVLGILGDLIDGYLRNESRESNSLSPTESVLEVRDILISGIDFLLNNTDLYITIPCVIDNHGRTTEKIEISRQAENSYAWLLYQWLAEHYKNHKRIKFVVGRGDYVYQDIYDIKCRFWHGHQFKYNGGVGGIFIPLLRHIDKLNNAKHADIDFLAHYHQTFIHRRFIVNGSILGYDEYAFHKGLEFEPPQQFFGLLDKDRKRITLSAPLFLT